MHYLTLFTLMIGLLTTPALAQEQPTTPVAAEVVAPTDAADAADAADATPTEADKAEPVATEGDKAAEAPKAPETDAEAIQTVLSLVDALKAGQWPLAAGLFLTLLVYLVNRFALKDSMSEKVLPWVAGGLGAAGAIGTGLLTGMPVVDAVAAGVLAGVMAVGGWEALLKHMIPKKDEPETT